jgi:hypothetical protein
MKTRDQYRRLYETAIEQGMVTAKILEKEFDSQAQEKPKPLTKEGLEKLMNDAVGLAHYFKGASDNLPAASKAGLTDAHKRLAALDLLHSQVFQGIEFPNLEVLVKTMVCEISEIDPTNVHLNDLEKALVAGILWKYLISVLWRSVTIGSRLHKWDKKWPVGIYGAARHRECEAALKAIIRDAQGIMANP